MTEKANDRALSEGEITPAMIEAGAEAWSGFEVADLEAMLCAVYSAMRTVGATDLRIAELERRVEELEAVVRGMGR